MVEAEQRTEAATALLLDLSFSMPLRGHFVHAKKMALALHALIEGRYPHDTLYLIGFSDYARQLQPEDLTAPGFERVYGTNMQHAFMLANRLLSQHPRATRQVIMVTDGEPTAHLEGDQAFFSWPPVRETIERTLAEAMRLAKAGVRLNIFMLEESEGLARFMERLARITRGRVFLMDDDRVGDFVLRDYVAQPRAVGSEHAPCGQGRAVGRSCSRRARRRRLRRRAHRTRSRPASTTRRPRRNRARRPSETSVDGAWLGADRDAHVPRPVRGRAVRGELASGHRAGSRRRRRSAAAGRRR